MCGSGAFDIWLRTHLIVFQHMAAALYLAAGVGAILGLVLPAPKVLRGARWGLALGALAQGAAFTTLHRLEVAPTLTELGQAIAIMAWLGVLFTLALLSRFRLPGFVPPLAFVGFMSAFGGTLSSPILSAAPLASNADAFGSIPHAHVLLASAGIAALGIAGLAGFFFLVEHHSLKTRRSLSAWMPLPLPSLETLDRVNRLALVLGFPLLTLGVLTGSLWLHSRSGLIFSGSLHEAWTIVAWMIYLGLVALRFGRHQGARQAAASAVAGFSFLVFAVVGVGLVT
jgi:ABC-type transport system involved in cytochrome c biogenesis permease subunit